MGFLIKEVDSDVHKSVNFNDLYHRACTEGNFIASYFDSANTELRDIVRREAIAKNYIQNDPYNPDNVTITEEGIHEFHGSTGIA